MIEVCNFTKCYDQFMAVDHLSFTVEKGEIFGFIGPNGAGKTTTIRFLSTLLSPTSGTATINGHDVVTDSVAARYSFGYMPDDYGVYEGMRVWEFLDFFGSAYGLDRRKRHAVINDILVLMDLQAKRTAPVTALSRGMRQRLCMAKTLLHDPPVLILDEPASGLDPRARIEMKELLREFQAMGKTILISSHILSELADCCTTIGIIERGKLLAFGGVREIMNQVRENVTIEMELHDGADIATRLLQKHPHVRNMRMMGNSFSFDFLGRQSDIADVHAFLITEGAKVLWFREREATLEEAFLTITKGEVI